MALLYKIHQIGLHRSGIVNVQDSGNLRIGFLDSTYANDIGAAPFGYIRFAQRYFLKYFGSISHLILVIHEGAESVNQWSDSTNNECESAGHKY